MPELNEIVTVYNRCPKDLVGTWNGRHYDFPARKEAHVPKQVALAARYQNPVMGIGMPADDWQNKAEYYLAIKEDGDPMSDIELSGAPQRWNEKLVNQGNFEYRKLDTPRPTADVVNLDPSQGFTDPNS